VVFLVGQHRRPGHVGGDFSRGGGGGGGPVGADEGNEYLSEASTAETVDDKVEGGVGDDEEVTDAFVHEQSARTFRGHDVPADDLFERENNYMSDTKTKQQAT